MVTTEPAHQRGHRVGGEGRQAGQRQRPCRQAGDRGHCRPSCFEVAQHLSGRPEECRSGRSELHPVSDPVEEPDAEVGFQLLHGQGQGRLGNENRLGRGGKPAMVDHGHEVLEPASIHLHSLSI